MPRLIDSNALKSEYEWLLSVVNPCSKAEIRDTIERIEKAPTVDAVEVVRCKDCKHFVQGEPYDPCECMKWKVKWGAVYTTPDGYCHKGERKDNG